MLYTSIWPMYSILSSWKMLTPVRVRNERVDDLTGFICLAIFPNVFPCARGTISRKRQTCPNKAPTRQAIRYWKVTPYNGQHERYVKKCLHTKLESILKRICYRLFDLIDNNSIQSRMKYVLFYQRKIVKYEIIICSAI